MSFIVTNNLGKDYELGKTIVPALRGVSIEIKKGEYVCVAGPSGAGKSTLLNLIGLLDDPSAGTILFDDVDVNGLKPKQRHRFRKRRIAFIFQNFNLIPVLSAYENIEFPLLVRKVDRRKRRERIEKLAEETGIAEFLRHRPDELSGGQRQRVAIARALVTHPEVVLADEPTANLDSVTGQNILALLQRLNQEARTTFIIASHDPKIMEQADRVIRMIDGRIVGGTVGGTAS
jgi:putative ABC transport system ATP-binding protein